jgi:hypothetical protein
MVCACQCSFMSMPCLLINTHTHTHKHAQVRCDVELEALRLLIENVHLRQAINRFVHTHTDWSETEKESAGRVGRGGGAAVGGREGGRVRVLIVSVLRVCVWAHPALAHTNVYTF